MVSLCCLDWSTSWRGWLCLGRTVKALCFRRMVIPLLRVMLICVLLVGSSRISLLNPYHARLDGWCLKTTKGCYNLGSEARLVYFSVLSLCWYVEDSWQWTLFIWQSSPHFGAIPWVLFPHKCPRSWPLFGCNSITCPRILCLVWLGNFLVTTLEFLDYDYTNNTDF